MSGRHFGTDGIRGVANQKLTPELAFKVGRAAGELLRSDGRPLRAVLGRDTRRSGPMLGAALASGLCSVGVDVTALGVVPTPTVSFAARTLGYGLGAIISASHNPAPDNGIKLVGHDGRKLPDEVESDIERRMEAESDSVRPVGGQVGALETDRSAVEAYLDALVHLVPERLDGMSVAMDAAHGAAYELGPEVLIRLGAEVVLTGAEPDGMNINAEGGATKPEHIGKVTLKTESEVGVAFDGDADRAVFCDERGRLINGDRTIGIWSGHWQRHGKLDPRIVVGTVMCNGGFERFLEGRGVALERTPVGDKYVARRLEETRARIGGEPSGHIIFPEHGPTGDGLVTMLELLRVLRREGRPASAFYEDYTSWPQVLINVAVARRDGWEDAQAVRAAMVRGEALLDGRGRIVVRASGTQPMIRVMVEADAYAIRDEVADAIVDAMRSDLGGEIYSKVDLTHALGD